MSQTDNSNNEWSSYGKLVLSELERHEDLIKEADQRTRDIKEKDLPAIHTELATLKTKAMIFGALAGTVFSAIAIAIAETIIHHS